MKLVGLIFILNMVNVRMSYIRDEMLTMQIIAKA